MLKSLKSAVHIKGRKNTAIARDLERTPHTVNKWLCGSSVIPQRCRAGLEAAIGAPIDWAAYEAEFAELDAPRAAKRAAAAAPPPAPAPEMPATAPNPPAQAPRRLTATPPPAKPTPRPAAPPKASAPVPPARKGLLASLFSDDGDFLT